MITFFSVRRDLTWSCLSWTWILSFCPNLLSSALRSCRKGGNSGRDARRRRRCPCGSSRRDGRARSVEHWLEGQDRDCAGHVSNPRRANEHGTQRGKERGVAELHEAAQAPSAAVLGAAKCGSEPSQDLRRLGRLSPPEERVATPMRSPQVCVEEIHDQLGSSSARPPGLC